MSLTLFAALALAQDLPEPEQVPPEPPQDLHEPAQVPPEPEQTLPKPAQIDEIAATGHRIEAVGGQNNLVLSESAVFGGDGGVWMTTVRARMVQDAFSVGLRMPFASYRTANGRQTGLGNLTLDGWMQLDATPEFEHAVGVIVTVNPGGGAYTWVNDAGELWPGGGVAGAWQMRSTTLDRTTLMARAQLGLHGARGYAPFPKFYPRLLAAGGIDQVLTEDLGLISELALSYWDISPVELSAFTRYDPVDGMRLKGGLVLPLFTWFGWDPTGQRGGARELTLRLDVQTAW